MFNQEELEHDLDFAGRYLAEATKLIVEIENQEGFEKSIQIPNICRLLEDSKQRIDYALTTLKKPLMQKKR